MEMESNTFEKNGKVYWAKPDIEVRVNGVRKLSPSYTFEVCCEEMELADVIEQEVYPQYHVGKDGEEDYVSYTSPLIVVVKERLSVVKDTRWLPRGDA
jgi:hypothetical protein